MSAAVPVESRLTLPQGRGEVAVRSWHVDSAPADAVPTWGLRGGKGFEADLVPLPGTLFGNEKNVHVIVFM